MWPLNSLSGGQKSQAPSETEDIAKLKELLQTTV